jgi:hypothetical protein
MVVVDRFSKMANFIALPKTEMAKDSAQAFLKEVWKLHRLPESIISDQDAKWTMSSRTDYEVSWELRRGCLRHFILRRTDKRKELTKLSKPISAPSSITTKMTGTVYYH